MTMLSPAQQKRQFLVSIVKVVLAVFLFFALFNVIAPEVSKWRASDAPPPAASIPTAKPVIAPAPVTPAITMAPMPVVLPQLSELQQQEIETARRIQEEARTLARGRLTEVRQLGDQALAQCDAFDAEIKHWNSTVPMLLSNDDGRLLAGKLEYVQAFRSLFDRPRPDRDMGRHARARLSQLLGPVDEALTASNSAYAPSATLIGEIEREKAQLVAATETFQRVREQFEAMVADAQIRRTPAPKTLQSVIDDLVAQEVEAHARAIGAAHEAATGTVREQLARAESKKVLAIGAAEERHVDAEKKAQTKRIEADTVKTDTKGERDRLLALAKDVSIQQQFAPFLTKGTTYPARYEGYTRWLPRKPRGRTMPRPVNLYELKTCGALDNLEKFVVAASSSKSASTNDRPHWTFPTTDADWDQCRQRFEQFQELLPIWVELGIVPSSGTDRFR